MVSSDDELAFECAQWKDCRIETSFAQCVYQFCPRVNMLSVAVLILASKSFFFWTCGISCLCHLAYHTNKILNVAVVNFEPIRIMSKTTVFSCLITR